MIQQLSKKKLAALGQEMILIGFIQDHKAKDIELVEKLSKDKIKVTFKEVGKVRLSVVLSCFPSVDSCLDSL